MKRIACPLLASAVLVGAFFAFPATGLPNSPAKPDRTLDFDRDVRPILSENCFACHGPDAKKRQAGLRLDNPEGAAAKLPSGNIAIEPGKAHTSILTLRVSSRTMPPESSGKKLSPSQIEILRIWVRQGAKYAKHWAFVPPRRPIVPREAEGRAKSEIRNPKSEIQHWSRNPIDRFILARLTKEGLRPSPEADRRTLLRRVSFDLTGLPPTLAEMDAFLADKSPDAYEKQVDRLLASPHYGERMAIKWLDLARYADTHGYHIDSHRDMWRWRDWVIDAFNRNMPYDEFTIEQLAGDLLPNATLSQKVATGFNRNHPINFEGGAIPEEYQMNYIIDRIDTTATTWMALTLRCGQCHDHKYDPLTTRDYYRFYAFFNNVPEQGLDGTKGNAVPFIKAPMPEQEAQLAEFDRKIATARQAVDSRAKESGPGFVAWQPKALSEIENVPAISNGLVAYYPLDEGTDEYVRDRVNRLPLSDAERRKVQQVSELPGIKEGSQIRPISIIRGKPAWGPGKIGMALMLDGNTACELHPSFSFDRTDHVSYGAWINPQAGGAMTVISRMDDAAANRGWDLYLSEGKVFTHLINKWESNAIRVNTKTAVPQNQWTHVFVTYDGSSKAEGVKIYINGKPAEVEITHNSLSGTIRTDKAARIGRRTDGAPFKGIIDEVRFYNRTLSPSDVDQLVQMDSIRPILLTASDKRTPEQTETLRRHYLENNDTPYRKLAGELAGLEKQRADLDNSISTTMVMEELPKPRDCFVHIRGQYDKLGEKVTAAVPAVFNPMPADQPPNRLSLAKWLVSPENSLTARAAVNRLWQMVFGTGLVKTAENFGIQGERPSHPELLDWLACEFMKPEVPSSEFRVPSPSAPAQNSKLGTRNCAMPWDVKHILRLIVTSSAYRQSSVATKELLAKDPENRLIGRYTRVRLPAEFVRDQALAVSGLLVPKIGGPSVKPYHPAGLWEEMAFGGGFTAQTYVQDHGENLYRRTMYTFWKRTVPPPSLLTFDAPEREFCVVRRFVTNTPLQALVLMNDPTYVEAARKFAERVIKESPAFERDRIRYAYMLALGRAPKAEETDLLLGVLHRQLDRFHKDPESAKKFLSVGESSVNGKLNQAELAAWSAISSMILNLDETITKS